jgi:hypothetical protein
MASACRIVKERVEGTSAALSVFYQGISDHQSDRSLRAIYRHAFTNRLPALSRWSRPIGRGQPLTAWPR